MPGTRRYDAVLCDNDGCLVAETNVPFDLPNLARIADFNRRAIADADRPVLTVCSGRPQPFVEAICRLVANTALPCIAENGAWLYHPGSNAYTLDPDVTEEDLGVIRDAERWCRESLADRGVTIQPGKTAMISLYHEDPDVLRVLEPDIRAGFEGRGWGLRLSRTVTYLNCDLPQISKASGIARFLAHTGLHPDRLAGIGDSPSDLAIRERVAFFACPANATDEVKHAADYVSDHEEAAGVLDVLARL